jgi:hypothetical protein
MNLMYTPFRIVSALVAGKLAKRLFGLAWGLIDDDEPPNPEHHDVRLWKLAVALVLEGALVALIRGVIDHGSRRLYHRVTGEWPGEEEPGDR